MAYCCMHKQNFHFLVTWRYSDLYQFHLYVAIRTLEVPPIITLSFYIVENQHHRIMNITIHILILALYISTFIRLSTELPAANWTCGKNCVVDDLIYRRVKEATQNVSAKGTLSPLDEYLQDDSSEKKKWLGERFKGWLVRPIFGSSV